MRTQVSHRTHHDPSRTHTTTQREDLGARVRLPIDFFEAFDAGVRVNLRGTDARMAEEFLYGAQIRAAVNQMRGEAVPQRVRAEPCPFADRRQQPHDRVLNSAWAHTPTALADAWETECGREGIATFLEKRPPSWRP